MSNYDFREVTNHAVELMGLKNQKDIRKGIWDDLHNHYCLPVKVRDGKAEWDDDMLARILGISL